MPQYVRAKGSIFFFTVVLAQRPSDLFVEEIDRLRRIYQAVQRRHSFETVAICVLPDHIHALGVARGRRRFFHALELDKKRIFAGSRCTSQINEQGRQA